MSTKKLQILDYNIKQAENADTVDGKHANEFYPAQKRFVFGGDYNSLMTNGIYELLGTSERPTQNAPNGNNSDNDYYVQVFAHSANYITQIATSGRRDKTQYIRSLSNGVWDSWEKIKSGDADTVDGKHASDFAAASDVSALQVKVGDTSVSEQISTAISEIDYPVDSVNGKTGAVMLTANDVGALPVDTEIPSISGLATETYVDSKVAGIVDSAPETLNTLNELSAALGDDPNFATTIATQIGGKVDKVNGKGLSTNDYTTGEKNKLAGIAAGANKTIIDSALSSTSTNPVQNKVVTTQINNLNTLVGDTIVSDQISTAIADKVDKVPGKGLSTNDYTTAEKNKLSGIASGAEVNQNAFSNVIVGSTTVAADTAADTLTLVAGNNVTLTPDATNDKITIAAKDTTYSAATTSAPGLMSASDKTKLNGIATGATKITVDSALSSTSTNPVQNKVVNTAISSLNALVGDTAVSTQIDNAIASIDAAITDDIATAIDSIEIGGRNLLLNTQTFSEASSTTLSGALLSGAAGLISETYRDLSVRGGVVSDNQLVVCRYGFKNFNLGETFTFSFFAKGNVPEIRVYFYGETGYVQVAKCVNSQGETNTNSDGRCSFSATEDWKRYWVKWTLKTTGDISVPKWIMIRTNGATSGQTVYVCGCKLEIGNKATDWSPAPEDNITNAIDAVEIGSRNIATGTAAMSIGVMNSATWKNGQWRKSGTGDAETIDIIDSPVSGVNKSVKLTASEANKQIGICQDLIPLNNTDVYTLSCWVRGSSSGLTCRLQPFYASSTDTGGVKDFTLTGEWQYISYTTVRSPLNTATYSGSYVYLIPSSNGDTMEICGLKLERGNKPTDWSPAPEDMDAKTNEAAKTATNYMKFNNNGLVIGNMTADTLGCNVLIDSDSVDIKNGDTILSQFTSDTIYLGKNSSSYCINVCDGAGQIYNDPEYNDRLTIKSNGGIILYPSDNLIVSLAKSGYHGLMLLGTDDFHVSSRGFVFDAHLYTESGHSNCTIQVGDKVDSSSSVTPNTATINLSGDCTGSENSIINLDADEIRVYGDMSTTGTLVLSKTTDASGTANNSPALIVGGTSTQPHLEFDANEIMAKSDGTTTSTLTINRDGGNVYIGDEGKGNLFGVCQEVTQGSLTPSATATIYKTGRTKVLIEMWTTSSSGYYNSVCETISSSMTAVSQTALVKQGNSTGAYSISKSGVITLHNNKLADANLVSIKYKVTHFN